MFKKFSKHGKLIVCSQFVENFYSTNSYIYKRFTQSNNYVYFISKGKVLVEGWKKVPYKGFKNAHVEQTVDDY